MTYKLPEDIKHAIGTMRDHLRLFLPSLLSTILN